MKLKSSTVYFLNFRQVWMGARISGGPKKSLSVSVDSVSSSVVSVSDPETEDEALVGEARVRVVPSALPVWGQRQREMNVGVKRGR